VADEATIQVQDQFGKWQHFQTVAATAASIKQALASALKSPMGKKSKKARAIDKKTKAIIDIAMG